MKILVVALGCMQLLLVAAKNTTVVCTMMCADGYRCVDDRCVPQRESHCNVKCIKGFKCIQNRCVSDILALYEDKCAGVRCDGSFTCKNGKCVPLQQGSDAVCEMIECRSGFHCVKGKCIENPGPDSCANINCPAKHICVKGKCLHMHRDACKTIKCGEGYSCRWGKCLKDKLTSVDLTCKDVSCATGS